MTMTKTQSADVATDNSQAAGSIFFMVLAFFCLLPFGLFAVSWLEDRTVIPLIAWFNLLSAVASFLYSIHLSNVTDESRFDKGE